MTESFPFAVRDRWRPGARFVFRVGRRTLVDSLYLLTAPVTAAAGLLLALGGLCAGTVGLLLPGGSPVVAGVLAPARWFADLERWRIAKVRSAAAGAGTGHRPRPRQAAAASDPGLWLDAAHAVVVFPVTLVTSMVTALWWFAGLGGATSALRAASMGVTAPAGRLAFGTAAGLLLLLTLPLVTRACVA